MTAATSASPPARQLHYSHLRLWKGELEFSVRDGPTVIGRLMITQEPDRDALRLALLDPSVGPEQTVVELDRPSFFTWWFRTATTGTESFVAGEIPQMAWSWSGGSLGFMLLGTRYVFYGASVSDLRLLAGR